MSTRSLEPLARNDVLTLVLAGLSPPRPRRRPPCLGHGATCRRPGARRRSRIRRRAGVRRDPAPRGLGPRPRGALGLRHRDRLSRRHASDRSAPWALFPGDRPRPRRRPRQANQHGTCADLEARPLAPSATAPSASAIGSRRRGRLTVEHHAGQPVESSPRPGLRKRSDRQSPTHREPVAVLVHDEAVLARKSGPSSRSVCSGREDRGLERPPPGGGCGHPQLSSSPLSRRRIVRAADEVSVRRLERELREGAEQRPDRVERPAPVQAHAGGRRQACRKKS